MRGTTAGVRWWRATVAVAVVAAGAVLAGPADAGAAVGTSLRFGGGGVSTPGADRVLIPMNPTNAADVGATNFTVELWMAATAADNPSGSVGCDTSGYTWITGHILLDRDRFPGVGSDGRDWGMAVTTSGRLAFGVQSSGGSSYTACTSGVNVLDGAWHHVAFQRSTSGLIEIFVDGVLRGQGNGPAGDVSYPDGAPTNRPGSDPYLAIGAEKHDAGSDFPSYRGLVDEVRISTVRRYSSSFTRPSAPFSPDGSTAVLYHLDGTPGPCPATLADATGRVNASCITAGGLPAFDASTPFSEPLPTTPSTFTPVTPVRLRDTRPSRIPAGGSIAVAVGGANGVPAGVRAVTVNLTAVSPTAGGYLTAWPCGQPVPPTSNLNYAAGQTVANLATVALGPSGQLCVLTSAPAAILVDLTGWWGDGGQRFSSVAPARLHDSRPGSQAAGAVLQVPVAGANGVPAGAQAASLTLTVVGPATAGYLTAWPCGQPQPATSNLNYAAGQTVANLTAIKLGGGAVCIASSATAAVVVDLTGWWGSSGSLQLQPPSNPSRLLDTRPTRVAAGGVVAVTVPSGISSALLNLTVTGPTGGGYLTAWPCGQPQPATSNLNYAPGQTVAAAAVAAAGTGNQVCIRTFAPASVIVDLFGGMAAP